MNNTPNSEQNDQPTLPSSIRLDLIAALIATIEDFFVILSILESIDEFIIAEEEEKKAQKELDEKFQKIQLQIDELSNELSKMKYQSYKYP
ncbi:hypothetical protein [Peribacillus alkalitolerans]|uniref:hypothetical protein n=1 Tax=Peribacillus alkalitolerans TaxID=1550385 RepID=UPI0013D3C3F2|nr:hypothetical protein [Peribacillus alkalitolerans]